MHEQSITVGLDDRFFNLPTVYGGKKVSEEEAVSLYKKGQLKALGEYGTQEEAVKAARQRSDTHKVALVDQYPRLANFAKTARAEGYGDQEIDQWLRQKFISPAVQEGYSAEEINRYLGVKEVTEKPSIREPVKEGAKQIAALGTRIAPALVGAGAGAAVGTALFPGVGTAAGFVGGLLGGSLGAGSGETLAQYLFDEKFSPKQIALQMALGLIPGIPSTFVRAAGGKMALRAAEGALYGAGGTAASRLIEGEEVGAGETAGGGLMGALFGLLLGKYEAGRGQSAKGKAQSGEIPPHLKERAAAIEKELQNLDYLRQSPEGMAKLREHLAQEEAKGKIAGAFEDLRKGERPGRSPEPTGMEEHGFTMPERGVELQRAEGVMPPERKQLPAPGQRTTPLGPNERRLEELRQQHGISGPSAAPATTRAQPRARAEQPAPPPPSYQPPGGPRSVEAMLEKGARATSHEEQQAISRLRRDDFETAQQGAIEDAKMILDNPNEPAHVRQAAQEKLDELGVKYAPKTLQGAKGKAQSGEIPAPPPPEMEQIKVEAEVKPIPAQPKPKSKPATQPKPEPAPELPTEAAIYRPKPDQPGIEGTVSQNPDGSLTFTAKAGGVVKKVDPARLEFPEPVSSSQPAEKAAVSPKSVQASRAKLEDHEVSLRTFIERHGGMKIPKGMEEEFGAWRRFQKKDSMGADEMAEEMHAAGLIPEPTINSMLEAKRTPTKSNVGQIDAGKQEVEALASEKMRDLAQTPAELEYKGKTYTGAEIEGQNLRLKDKPDKVLKKADDILAVEEKIPFDIPPPANPLADVPLSTLIKKSFSETGAIGRLTPEMRAAEAEAKAHRKELYRRVTEAARAENKTIREAGEAMDVNSARIAALEAEAAKENWQAPNRRFSPLEKEMGKSADTAAIFDPIPNPFKGTRLSTPTTKAITEAAFETYRTTGKKIDPDIPITIQVSRDLAEGNISLPLLKETLEARGSNLDQLGEALLATESNAGRQLQHMSALKQRLKTAGIDLGPFKEPPPSGWEYAGDLFRRWINIWRGALVTQLSTAVRNLETQTARLSINTLEQMTDGVIRQMFRVGPESERGLSPAFGKVIESYSSLLRSHKRQQAADFFNIFPDQKTRLFYQYASDVAQATREHQVPPGRPYGVIEKVTQTAEDSIDVLNVFNRGQEFLVRKAAFRAKLADLLSRKGQSIDSIDPRALDENDIAQAVDHALEMTFAVTPHKGLGKWILDLYENPIGRLLNFVAPFPRFMWNSWKFFSDFSPAGFIKLLSAKERAAIAQGNTKALSRAVIGTGLLGTAYMIRNSDFAGEKWYEIEAGGKTIDTRPFNPFSSYLFVADVVKRVNEGTLTRLGFKELAQGLFSANFRAGAGLFMLDQVGDLVGGLMAGEGFEKAWENLKRSSGEVVGGFLTPLQTIRDVLSDERLMSFLGAEEFAKEEAKPRDVRGREFWGPLESRIPGMSQGLPERQFPLGEQRGREEPILKQATGVITRTKTLAEKEADRLGFEPRDLLHPTGIPELDRLTAERMRPGAERTLTALIRSPGYQAASDLQKRVWFKKWMQEIANTARRDVLAKNRELKLEWVIKQAGKDKGKLLRQTYESRGLLAPQ